MCFQVVIFYYKVSQELQTGHIDLSVLLVQRRLMC